MSPIDVVEHRVRQREPLHVRHELDAVECFAPLEVLLRGGDVVLPVGAGAAAPDRSRRRFQLDELHAAPPPLSASSRKRTHKAAVSRVGQFPRAALASFSSLLVHSRISADVTNKALPSRTAAIAARCDGSPARISAAIMNCGTPVSRVAAAAPAPTPTPSPVHAAGPYRFERPDQSIGECVLDRTHVFQHEPGSLVHPSLVQGAPAPLGAVKARLACFGM